MMALEKSSWTYVLTHFLFKTSFWIVCGYQLPTFQTVVIKIGWFTYFAELNYESEILQKCSGIEGVQQLVEFGLIVGSNSCYAMVTIPLGIPLSKLYSSPISKKEATKIVLKVSQILHQIHQRNIVHRDIKPSNIIMVNEEPIIIDFGCSIECPDSGISSEWAGTVEYTALNSQKKTLSSHDYESLVYTAISLTRPLLPWSRNDQNLEVIKKRKNNGDIGNFSYRI